MTKKVILSLITVTLFTLGIVAVLFFSKYRVDDVMVIPIEEVSKTQYLDDPSERSRQYGNYHNRYLRLEKKDDYTFNFVFESKNPNVATITFKNIDMRLFVPIVPYWLRDDEDLTTIALVEREWNRQQVSFPSGSSNLEISGGNGFETKQLISAELARNCLNAGLWEVMLYNQEGGRKSLYYQGWFNFPLGHYKEIFEKANNISYWKHWYRLEHWFNPQGTQVNLSNIRGVTKEYSVPLQFIQEEPIIIAGEQARKSKFFHGNDLTCWRDFCKANNQVNFAAFIPPGRYSNTQLLGHDLNKIAHIEKAVVRKVRCPASPQELDEIEIIFRDDTSDEPHRFIVGGMRLNSIPQLSTQNYPKGLYMPMGLGIGPFYQSFDNLSKSPPQNSPYYSLFLNSKNEWVNHHTVGIDGPVIHRDLDNPNLLHIYLLSYERHTLVGHYKVRLEKVR